MAQLTEIQKDELSAELMRYISREHVPCDLNKTQLRSGIDIFDAGLETAESDILDSVSAPAQTWLTSHVTVSRWVLEKVAKERREEL